MIIKKIKNVYLFIKNYSKKKYLKNIKGLLEKIKFIFIFLVMIPCLLPYFLFICLYDFDKDKKLKFTNNK